MLFFWSITLLGAMNNSSKLNPIEKIKNKNEKYFISPSNLDPTDYYR